MSWDKVLFLLNNMILQLPLTHRPFSYHVSQDSTADPLLSISRLGLLLLLWLLILRRIYCGAVRTGLAWETVLVRSEVGRLAAYIAAFVHKGRGIGDDSHCFRFLVFLLKWKYSCEMGFDG